MKLNVALLTAGLCFAATAQAEDKTTTKPAAATTTEMKHDASAMTWKPSKVTNEKEAKKGLEALIASDEAAMKSGSVEQMVANVDFPVTMITDDAAGNGDGSAWTKDQFTKMMTEAWKNMPKDMKTTHKWKYDVLTDGLAVVHDDCTMVMGKEKTVTKNASIAIKKDGKWMWKTMAEGGWGTAKPPKATGGSGTP